MFDKSKTDSEKKWLSYGLTTVYQCLAGGEGEGGLGNEMKILFNSYMQINCSLLAAAIVFIRYMSQTVSVTTFSHSKKCF